jgi:hypothetical protein
MLHNADAVFEVFLFSICYFSTFKLLHCAYW